MQIVIIGGSGGLGEAFTEYFLQDTECEIISTYNNTEPKKNLLSQGSITWEKVDVTNESQVAEFCSNLEHIKIFINAAGMLHNSEYSPEKSTRQIDREYMLKSIEINTLPTMLFAKYLTKAFRHQEHSVFATISARVGSIEENYLGGWYSYRASKAALNQILKTLSIEWSRNLKNVCVAALHPGTTDTKLSAPFHRNVPESQIFSPDKSVIHIGELVKKMTPDQTGQFWSFDGEKLPW